MNTTYVKYVMAYAGVAVCPKPRKRTSAVADVSISQILGVTLTQFGVNSGHVLLSVAAVKAFPFLQNV
jgi:hypothetical protein